MTRKLLLSWFVWAILGLGTARAAEPTVMFVLDASGSMSGQMEGKAKLDIAKDVLARLAGDLAPDVDVGLLVFGHRSKDDCGDVELLVQPGKGSGRAVAEKLQPVKPLGKTPIGGSIKQAAEHLKARGGDRTVVLVSDGAETCGGDPSRVVEDVIRSGIDVKVHVIGFDVTAGERAQLEAVARAGRGQYYNARTAGELKEAFGKVKEVVVEAKVARPAPLPKGGDIPEAAVPLRPGEYVADRELPSGAYEYYAIPIKAGQTLVVAFRTPDAQRPYAGAAIYGERRGRLVAETIIGDPGAARTIGWSTNSRQDAYTLYLVVGNEYSANAKGARYSISIEDNADAGSRTEAGEAFERALEIRPGKYAGFLSGEWGDDHRDFYRVALKAKEKVTVKVTPPTDVAYRVTILNEDREKVAEKTAANPGAIVRASWTAPSAQEVYLLVEPETGPAQSARLPYSLEVAVER